MFPGSSVHLIPSLGRRESALCGWASGQKAGLWGAGQPVFPFKLSISQCPGQMRTSPQAPLVHWAGPPGSDRGTIFLFNTSKFWEKNTSSWGARRLQGLWWPPLPTIPVMGPHLMSIQCANSA